MDIQAVTDVAANIGQSDMSLIHVQDAIDKATQTAIIAETLKQGVILQETTNCLNIVSTLMQAQNVCFSEKDSSMWK